MTFSGCVAHRRKATLSKAFQQHGSPQYPIVALDEKALQKK